MTVKKDLETLLDGVEIKKVYCKDTGNELRSKLVGKNPLSCGLLWLTTPPSVEKDIPTYYQLALTVDRLDTVVEELIKDIEELKNPKKKGWFK